MNKYLLRFDEINKFLSKFEGTLAELCQKLYDEMYGAYLMGWGEKEKPKEDLIEALIFFSYDGKDPFDLLEEAYNANDGTRIKTIFDNEYHRMYNAGAYDYAKGHYKTKKWVTAGDDLVRETHEYLEGITIPVDAEFITFDNDSALYPGGFSNASNNVNCRCILEYK